MPRKKAPGTAADPRNGEKFALVQADGEPRFDLPAELYEKLTPEMLDAWENYWFDPVSGVLNESDYVLVYRWVDALNRYFILVHEADRCPIMAGAQGQDVMNPKYQAANNALMAAERLEKQLGMGPSNRSRLGVELVQADGAAKKAQDEQVRRGDNPTQVTIERVDPREL